MLLVLIDDGDTTTFSIELDSTFETIFDEHVKISLRTQRV